LKVHEQFYAVLSAQEQLKTARGESEALRQSAKQTKERLSQGAGTITDQDDAEARWRTALATEIAAKTDYENNVKALAETVGQPCGNLEADCENCPLPEPGEDLDYWRHQAETANTGLLITGLQYRAAELVLQEKKGRFLPNLVAFADYSHRNSNGGLPSYGDERESMDAGLRLQMDLLAGGADTAAVIAASSRRDEAQERLTEAKRSLERSLTSLWDSLRDGKALTDASRQAAEASERALASTQTAYNEGLRTVIDLLDAQREHYRNLGQYQASRYNYLTLLARFRNVIGGAVTPAQPTDTAMPTPLPEHAATPDQPTNTAVPTPSPEH
jgi:outer membrane protein